MLERGKTWEMENDVFCHCPEGYKVITWKKWGVSHVFMIIVDKFFFVSVG